VNRALSIVSRSEEETKRLGSVVASHAGASSVIGLLGELGTGKTRLVEGAARGEGYGGRVRSPTFTLMNVYEGRRPVYHFDLYRLDTAADREVDEWAEVWEAGGLAFIEWADRLDTVPRGPRWPPAALFIHMAHRGGGLRRIVLEAGRGTWQVLFRSLETGWGHAYPRH
jgi:tRNA threonylcarbamoyladenosine biosynthesis protein TsaE